MPIQTISPHFLFFWQNVGLLLIQLAVQESGSNKHHRASLSAYPGKASAYPRTEEINTSGCSSLKKTQWRRERKRGERGRQQGQNSSTLPRTGTDVRVQLCTHLALSGLTAWKQSANFVQLRADETRFAALTFFHNLNPWWIKGFWQAFEVSVIKVYKTVYSPSSERGHV